ncbi:hypothetical protein vseg_015339 [Gypsophila vaccaria]
MNKSPCNLHNFTTLLKTCICQKDLITEKTLHAFYVKSLIPHLTYLSNHFILLYSKCRNVTATRNAFNATLSTNVYSYNALIVAYTKEGEISGVPATFRSNV